MPIFRGPECKKNKSPFHVAFIFTVTFQIVSEYIMIAGW